jgi:hypothetical protein
MKKAIIASMLGVIFATLFASAAIGAPHRSMSARAAFVRTHPCPATGAHRGACPGYVVDHVMPLCAGGADAPANMQWQTVADGKTKDRTERAECHHRRGFAP